MTTRRDFLIGGLSAGATLPVLGGKLAPQWLQAAGAGSPNRILVVVQARGGYDYLNLIIPWGDPTYAAARPNIGFHLAAHKNYTLPIRSGSNLRWHYALGNTAASGGFTGSGGFRALFDRGDLAILHDVGNPPPYNLSHFEKEKQMYAADPRATVLHEGWMARFLKKGYKGSAPIPIIDIEARQSPVFAGTQVTTLRNVNLFRFQSDTRYPSSIDQRLELAVMEQNASVLRPSASPNLALLTKATGAAFRDSRMLQTSGADYKPKVPYPPNSSLARDLQLAARYITGGSNPKQSLDTEVYWLSTGGFDHHATEVQSSSQRHLGRLNNLLRNLADSIKAFLDDIEAHKKATGLAKDVVVLVITEFGRRFGENGSLGTDHGQGGVAFLAGKPVRGGEYGKYPDLSKATKPYNNYYIPFTPGSSIDYRSIYAEVLEKWLGVPHAPILGSTFPLIGAL